jgi:hypothetical protein
MIEPVSPDCKTCTFRKEKPQDDARQRIAELKAQRLQVEAEIATLKEASKIITLHPATLDRYVEMVDALAAGLAEHAAPEDDRGSLVKSFRALVQSVTVHPNGPREGFQLEVKGKLTALVGRRCLSPSGL